ncbi:2-phosphosulfolactate phosphatase [Polluticoccus soli]|uniref:2-phosphosulfolactate phosphatase n=1 Tax=Polluticoccus soli TaxID=3034150 RepID=UPI0023E33D0C|nr:2-phosphosulfolactate phosphatase [Flavipsychrobacter sp. JY13-12]
MNRPVLEVCLSPALLHLYDTKDKVVVIIDVFRATSTIAAALHNGAKSVIPVASVAECIEIGKSTANSVTAGERDGKIAVGLEYGNSPSEYPRSFIENRTLVLTTTNGTRLLHMVQDAAVIITGAFLNLTAVCEFLVSQNKSVILGCAAWKDRFNLEDTLFAGAVASKVREHFDTNCDSVRAAKSLYESVGDQPLIDFLKDSSHYRRLSAYGLQADMEYCATPDLHPVVPILRDKELLVHV